jgi:hypothetical protein
MVIDIDSWDCFYQDLKDARIPTTIRFERTFVSMSNAPRCLAANDAMLMFFPDGRVYTCSMYFSQEEGNAYAWTSGGLIKNREFRARYGSQLAEGPHCPAMYLVNQHLIDEAENNGRLVGCIFDKMPIGGLQQTAARLV